MPSRELATAYISIVAETKGVKSEVESALKAVGKQGTTTGNTLGRNMSTAMGKQLSSGGTASGAAFSKSFTASTASGTKTAGTKVASGMTTKMRGAGAKAANEFVSGLVSGLGGGRLSNAVATPLSNAVVAPMKGIGVSGGKVLAAGLAAGVAVGAIAVTKQLYDLGAEWDDVVDRMAFRTGKLGTELDALKESLRKVAPETAASLGAIGDVQSQLAQVFKLKPGKGLEDLTKQVTDLNEISGEKLNIRDLGKVISRFGLQAEDAGKLVDDLTAASIDTAIPINELISLMTSKGISSLKEFGLSAGETAALLGRFEEAGIGPQEAIAGLQFAFKNFAKDGKDAQTELRNVITEIQNLIKAGNDPAAEQLALKTFGRGFAPMFEAIKGGTLDVQNLNTELGNTEGTVKKIRDETEDWQEDLQKLKNTLQSELQPTAEVVFGGMSNMITQYLIRPFKELNDIIGGVKTLWDSFFNNTPAPTGPATLDAQGNVVSAPQPKPGSSPLDIFRGGGGGGSAGLAPGQVVPGPGGFLPGTSGNAREFAHNTMMPYWKKQGFEVGDHAADQYGEHQNGALDVMVPNVGAGQRILPQVLQDPNVYGVIFNGQSYGYGRGMNPQPYSGPNPHTDHLHIWYKPKGMALGGGIPGYGGGDRIPILAEGGEFVVNKQATRQWLPLLEGINSGGAMPLGNVDTSDLVPGKGPGKRPRQIYWGGRRPSPGGWIPWPTPWELWPGGPPMMPHPRGPKRDRSGRPKRPIWTIPPGFEPGPDFKPEGPNRPRIVMPFQGFQKGGQIDPRRFEGWIPAAIESFGEPGTGAISAFFDMGAEAVNNVIDQAAGLAAGAAGVAAPGSGGVAGAAIGMGTEAAKRAVQWAADLGGIASESALQILSPLPLPRWLGYDYTSFIPSGAITDAFTTSFERMTGESQASGPNAHLREGAVPGQPIPPGPTGGPSGPSAFRPAIGSGAPGTLGHPSIGARAGQSAFTNAQMSSLQNVATLPPNQQPNFGAHIENMYTMDPSGFKRVIDEQSKLAMLRYAGRSR